jgi:hypothetical protein
MPLRVRDHQCAGALVRDAECGVRNDLGTPKHPEAVTHTAKRIPHPRTY